MAKTKRTYKAISGFPGYEIPRTGDIRLNGSPVEKFNDYKCVNLKKGKAIFAKRIDLRIQEVFE